MPRKNRKFIFRKSKDKIELREMMKATYIDGHLYFLAKCDFSKGNNWMIVDSLTGILIAKGRTIDETIECVHDKRNDLERIYFTSDYTKMKEKYETILDEWKREGDIFEKTVGGLSEWRN